jgi:hypothetical protein
MRLVWGLLSLAVVACASRDDGPEGDEAHVLDGFGDGKADSASAAPPGEIVRLSLDYAAVPGTDHPNMLVYIPSGLSTADGVNAVVYLHGHWNCIDNVVRAKNGPCVAGRAARQAGNLAMQLENSKKNAVLFVPELAFDAADSSDFDLDNENQFAWMMWDAMNHIGDKLGGAAYGDLRQIIVASHSGGWMTAAAIARRGGLDLNELWLLDSLYDKTDDFDAWVMDAGALLATRERRFANVYTCCGGTLANSQAMAARARGWVDDASVILDDRTGATLTLDQLRHGLLFKRSGLSHDDVPRYYFQKLLESSALPDKPTTVSTNG